MAGRAEADEVGLAAGGIAGELQRGAELLHDLGSLRHGFEQAGREVAHGRGRVAGEAAATAGVEGGRDGTSAALEERARPGFARQQDIQGRHAGGRREGIEGREEEFGHAVIAGGREQCGRGVLEFDGLARRQPAPEQFDRLLPS